MMKAQWDTAWLIWMIILIALACVAWLVSIGGGLVALRTKGDSGPGAFFGGLVAAIVIGCRSMSSSI